MLWTKRPGVPEHHNPVLDVFESLCVHKVHTGYHCTSTSPGHSTGHLSGQLVDQYGLTGRGDPSDCTIPHLLRVQSETREACLGSVTAGHLLAGLKHTRFSPPEACLSQGVRMGMILSLKVITTDASLSGWGAIHKVIMAKGVLSSFVRGCHVQNGQHCYDVLYQQAGRSSLPGFGPVGTKLTLWCVS